MQMLKGKLKNIYTIFKFLSLNNTNTYSETNQILYYKLIKHSWIKLHMFIKTNF